MITCFFFFRSDTAVVREHVVRPLVPSDQVLELRIGTKPTVVVTSRPDEPDRIEEEPVDLKAERRAKQKAATRFQAGTFAPIFESGQSCCHRDITVENGLFQDVEEDSYSQHDRPDRRKKRRGNCWAGVVRNLQVNDQVFLLTSCL